MSANTLFLLCLVGIALFWLGRRCGVASTVQPGPTGRFKVRPEQDGPGYDLLQEFTEVGFLWSTGQSFRYISEHSCIETALLKAEKLAKERADGKFEPFDPLTE